MESSLLTGRHRSNGKWAELARTRSDEGRYFPTKAAVDGDGSILLRSALMMDVTFRYQPRQIIPGTDFRVADRIASGGMGRVCDLIAKRTPPARIPVLPPSPSHPPTSPARLDDDLRIR